jgi:hypothetical protein
MNGRHASLVTCVECLQQIEGLGSAALTNDQAIGPHAQRLFDEPSQVDLSNA